MTLPTPSRQRCLTRLSVHSTIPSPLPKHHTSLSITAKLNLLIPLTRKPSLTTQHILLYRHPGRKTVQESTEAVASMPRGVAKLADRTHAHVPVDTQTHPITTPTFTSNDNRLAPAPSTICQSDKTGDGECLLNKDERNSTAEQEQLSKQLGHKQGGCIEDRAQWARSPWRRQNEQLQWSGHEGKDPQAEGLVTRLAKSFYHTALNGNQE